MDVKVADERGRPVFTVMFPRYFVPKGWKPFLVSGARALLLRLDAMNAVDDMSRVRVPAFRGAIANSCQNVKEGVGGRPK
jgi:hypothetical protein